MKLGSYKQSFKKKFDVENIFLVLFFDKNIDFVKFILAFLLTLKAMLKNQKK